MAIPLKTDSITLRNWAEDGRGISFTTGVPPSDSFSGMIHFADAFGELGRDMPRSCIPGKVKTSLVGILAQQDAKKFDHFVSVLLLRVEMCDLICGEFQGCCNDQSSFTSLSLRHNSGRAFRCQSHPTPHFHGEWTEFVYGEKLLIATQIGQNPRDLFQLFTIGPDQDWSVHDVPS